MNATQSRINLKTAAFSFAAILLPFVVLALLEVVLRLSGYQQDKQDLFMEFPGQPEYLIVNPDFPTRYFPNFEPQIAPTAFQKQKSPRAFRVFVLGGSSTQGFPYNFHNSFSARLEQLLMLETIDREIEVINLGMTAVNSFVLWDLAARLPAYQPDAVIIYAGHNEYYGSFGIGSTQFGFGTSVVLKRLVIRLKNLRLYQLLESVFIRTPEHERNRTMMSQVVRESDIELGSPLFEAGIAQYRKNMTDVVHNFTQNNITVYFGSLASNLKGQTPLGENEVALSFFQRADSLFQAGNIDSAYTYYLQAKEWDALRFRAPEAISDVIKELCDSELLTLVRIDSVAAEHSESGIPDNSFFDDHLHPNGVGNQRIGEAFFEALKTHPKIKSSISGNRFSNPLPISELEKRYAEVGITRLEYGYPFTKGLSADAERRNFENYYSSILRKSFVDSLAAFTWRTQRQPPLSFTDVINYATKKRDSSLVMRHYVPLAYWQIFNKDLLQKGINYGISNRSLDQYTVMVLHLATRHFPDELYINSSLGALYLINDDYQRAEYWLNRAETINPDDPNTLFNKARLYSFRRDSVNAKKYFLKYREQLINQQPR